MGQIDENGGVTVALILAPCRVDVECAIKQTDHRLIHGVRGSSRLPLIGACPLKESANSDELVIPVAGMSVLAFPFSISGSSGYWGDRGEGWDGGGGGGGGKGGGKLERVSDRSRFGVSRLNIYDNNACR